MLAFFVGWGKMKLEGYHFIPIIQLLVVCLLFGTIFVNNKRFIDGSRKVVGVVQQKELEVVYKDDQETKTGRWLVEVDFFNTKTMDVETKEISMPIDVEIGSMVKLRYNDTLDELKMPVTAVGVSWRVLLVIIANLIFFVLMKWLVSISKKRKRNKESNGMNTSRKKRKGKRNKKPRNTLESCKSIHTKLKQDGL